ncbi:MAG TPA: HD domain-containing protein [Dehalococcoidia bacterium]|nr:HD domain-containing protein [Dehalococcoidia bacterium]
MEKTTSIPLGSRFDRAVIYAIHIHGGQARKGTTIPYVTHLFSVAALVLEDGGDEDEAIGALLHDAAEDQGGRPRLEDIRARFGERVAQIVDFCTDTYYTPKPPYRQRKESYVAHLRDQTDQGALRVSLADKLHNARCILFDARHLGDHLWQRFNAGKEDQLWYHRSLLAAFRPVCHSPMVEEYERVVAELEYVAKGAAETQ